MDFSQFIAPLSGGLLIGTAASLLLLGPGKIAGISGIVWSAVSRQAESGWRWLFLLGLVLGTGSYHWLSGAAYPQANPAPLWLAALAGLVVGLGVKLGSGCTSGHGVCGLGRLSTRSLVATLTFMVTGIITVYIVRHSLGGV